MLFQNLSLARCASGYRWTSRQLGLAQRIGVESLNTEPITRFVPVIVGVSMVVRRKAYLDAGLIDEGTLIYGEEVGWHWRLRQHGWKLALVTEARITHYNPQSELTGWKLAEHRKSILQYFLNYRSKTQSRIIRCAIIGIHTIGTLVYWPLNRTKSRAHWQAVKVGLYWRSSGISA